jgi:signal transduction histidine kinase
VPAEEGRPAGWHVVVVASAGRERDREQRARIRLVITVALVAHLVLVFGVLALRQQRKEHALERELASAEVARERDQRLSQQSRAATMVTFAGGVAHEVSTPLGVIAGRAENLMARPEQDERTRRSLQTIVEQTAYIKEVIRGFLDLARGATPVLSEALPSSVVSAAAAMVEHRLHKAGVRLEVGSAEGLPSVRCDPRLLEHAIINLLLNACDASPRGGTVRLQVHAAAQTLGFVVSDEGAGIPQALASRVTEPFFTTKALGEGTGLGLAIASEIAKIHSGRLRLEAGVPRGTRACLEIPLLLPTAAPLAGKQPERARDA